jgi:hypothetical protein
MEFSDPYGTWPYPADWPLGPGGAMVLDDGAVAQIIASRKAAYESGEGASAGNISYAEARLHANNMKDV